MSSTAVYERDHRSLMPVVQALIATNLAMIVFQATIVTAADNAPWFGLDANALPSRSCRLLNHMSLHTCFWHFAVNVGYRAHLGGVLAAYLYIRIAMTGAMDQVRQRVANLPDADEPPRAIPRSLPRSRERDETDDIVAKSKAIVAKRPAALSPLPR